MESFGAYLKDERESRKISVAEISRATKIRRVILEAIERDQGEVFLPEVVIKGFVEAYARHLGLDPKEVLVKYSQWQEGSKAAERKNILRDEKRHIPPHYMVAGAVGVVVIIISFFVVFQRGPREGAQEATIAETSSEQHNVIASEDLQSSPAIPLVKDVEKEAAPLVSQPADTGGEKEGAKAEAVPIREHILVITATERTWIQIQEGSSLPLDVILYPGDNYTRKSSHPLAILIGNAGGVTVTFDGVGLGSLGEVGQVVRLTLPAPEEG